MVDISKKQSLQKEIQDLISSNLSSAIESTFDTKLRIKKDFNIDLEENQQEMLEAISDPELRNIAIVASRSGGKTFGIIISIFIISIENTYGRPIAIGITAPKSDQATRIINTFKTQLMYRSPSVRAYVDEKSSTNTKIIFKNGSFWEAFTANEYANEEGRHYDILVIDEAQKVADIAISQILLPMIGSSEISKTIKLGVPRYRNHFYRSFKSSNFTSLAYDWLHCGNLLKSGFIELKGIKYPKSIVDKMPLSKKKEYFPDNPEYWFEGEMSVEDFETQHEIKWLLNVDSLLNEQDQGLIVGDYEVSGPETDSYYFGLDLAGGSFVKSGSDFTALTIGRYKDGVKQLVDSYEWQGDVVHQMKDIIKIIHPQIGSYKCKFGLVDLGEIGHAVADILKDEGVILNGVMFGSRDSASGKNMKNAMYDHFLFELRSDRIKYPCREYINKNKVMRKHLDEWYAIERRLGGGINDIISAPTDGDIHDDGPSSGILCTWAMDRAAPLSLKNLTSNYKFPKILKGTSSVR